MVSVVSVGPIACDIVRSMSKLVHFTFPVMTGTSYIRYVEKIKGLEVLFY